MITLSKASSLDEDILYCARDWYIWLKSQFKGGSPPDKIAAMLLQIGSEIAILRGATLLEHAEMFDKALPYLKRCLKSNSAAIKASAITVMTFHERKARNPENNGGPNSIDAAISVLNKCLKELEASKDKSDFFLESRIEVMYNLSRLYNDSGDYQKSIEFSAEALYLSIPLECSGLTCSLQLTHATSRLLSGEIDVALQEFHNIIDSKESTNTVKFYSGIDMSFINLMNGDFKTALDIANSLVESYPSNVTAQLAKRYVSSLLGIHDDQHVTDLTQQDSQITLSGIDKLSQFLNTGTKRHLNECMESMKKANSREAKYDFLSRWAQGLALLKQKKVYLSAQRANFQAPKLPLFEALNTALRIEISLEIDCIDIESLETLCARMQNIFKNLPSKSARTGMAEIISYWHPKAAAFCALSPLSVTELVDYSLPAVYKDGRPIEIYGQGTSARLPFLQTTLEDFGINSKVPRDQSMERRRMAEVLLVPWMQAERWLPIVSPALLVFHFLRTAETGGPIWLTAGKELARSHGLVPKTLGGNLRHERSVLSDLLDKLLAQRISVSIFLEDVRAFSALPRSDT